MVQWLKYFLVGVEQSAVLALTTLSSIIALKVTLEQDLQFMFGRRAASAQRLLNAVFAEPSTSVEAV